MSPRPSVEPSPPREEVAHVLIVDDDHLVRAMLSEYLRAEHFRVSEAADESAMHEVIARSPVDLLLLDLVMPGKDGLTLLRQLRARLDLPVIMITSRDDVIDRVAGLEAGADDYIGKPFHPREVLARVRTVLRRLEGRGGPHGGSGGNTAPDGGSMGAADTVYGFAGFELHANKRRVVAPGDAGDASLTTAEFDLLHAFVTHPGHVLDRDRLMDLAKGRAWAASDRSVDQQVARLRRKIEPDPAKPVLIKSVRGAGYVFAAEVRRR